MVQPQKLARGVLRGQEHEIREALSELLESYIGDEDNPLNDAIEQVVFDLGGVGGMGVLTVNTKEGFVTLNQDEIPDGTTYKQYSTTEKTKLAGIQAGATANDTNTNLRNRATHTGTQPTSSITDFAESVRTILGAALVGGQNIEVVVDDLANTVTVNVVDIEGGGGAVASVNSQTGVVVLDADDISDTSTNNKFTTSFEQTKLAGIQSGATANATDSALRDRSTHTGTQPASTISDLPESVRDTIGATLQEGSNVTIDVDDENNIVTISATIEAGTGEVNSVNGATGVVTLDQDDIPDGTTFKQYSTGDKTKLAGIAAGATVNATDAALRDRATHTGTQTASTISDFQTAVSANTDVEDALDAAHAHSNKTILDNTTASFTTADETAIDGLATTYAPIAHDHDDDYADIIHDHDLDYSDIDHTHADIALNTAARHTHSNKVVLDATTASFLIADETKLDGIATGATANATNAFLLDRANHTGTQDVSSIEGLEIYALADHDHDDLYPTEAELTTALALKSDATHNHAGVYAPVLHNHDSDYADIVHNHDDLYFTESEVTTALSGKANTSHNHTAENVTDFDTEVSNNTDVAANTSARHTHSNAAVLNATTASFLTADETKLDGIEALADVTDAANVDAAGAVMNSDTTIAAMGFVLNENNMASNSATKVPTQASVKAYADTKAAASHSHDDLYFTESEVTTALSGKANTSHTHGVTDLTATGTPSSSTYLRGDNTWATPAGGPGGSGSSSTYDVLIRNNSGTYEAYDSAGTSLGTNAALHTLFNSVKGVGKSIFFVAGTYTVTSTLDFVEGLQVYGAGKATKFVRSTSGGIFRLVGTDVTPLTNLRLEGVWVSGPSVSGTQVSGSGIYMQYCSHSRVAECWVDGFGSLGDQGGIEGQEGVNNVVIYGNICWNNKNGICLGSPGSTPIVATDVLIERNTCYSNYDDGIHSQRCARIRYIGNTCYSQPNGGASDGAGIDLLGDEYDTVIGNICYGNGRGLEIGMTSSSPGDKGHVVQGNTLTGNTEYGMTIIGLVTGVQVVGNSLTNNGTNGIRFGTATSTIPISDVTISDNFFRDNGVYGIDAFGYVSKFDIIHNNFAGHTTNDVRVRASTGTPATYTIEGNRFQSAGNLNDTALASDAIIRNNRGYGTSGTNVTRLTNSVTYDPASLSTNVSATTTVTVTGAAVGDPAYASHTGVTSTERMILYARVTAANTVTVIFHNSNGATLNASSGTLRVDVLQFS